MKKLGLLFIFSIIIFSCTEKDGIFLSGNPPRSELDIKKIIEITYKNGDPSAYKVTVFNDRKLEIDSFYNKKRELIGYKKWTYNTDTLLIHVKTYDSLLVLVPEKTRNLFYDVEKRIDTITTINDTLAFNYDTDNLILGTWVNSATKDSLYLDSNQRIYKISYGLFSTEISLSNASTSNLKVTDLTTAMDTLTVNYNYNTILTPKGYLWNDSMTRTFKNSNNAVLFYSLQEAAEIYSPQFLSHIISNGVQNVITYITENGGYLKESNSAVNGDFRTKKLYFYE